MYTAVNEDLCFLDLLIGCSEAYAATAVSYVCEKKQLHIKFSLKNHITRCTKVPSVVLFMLHPCQQNRRVILFTKQKAKQCCLFSILEFIGRGGRVD